jgi:hypothetical protein
MPVTAVRTALSAGRARPSVPKVCVQSAHWYAFMNDDLTPVFIAASFEVTLCMALSAHLRTTMLSQRLISTALAPTMSARIHRFMPFRVI